MPASDIVRSRTHILVATQLLARTTSLLDGRRNVKMTWRLYLVAVVPIGVAYSGSMVSSNIAYLYLNAPFIHMLKAAAPVVTLLMGCVRGLEHLNWAKSLKVLLVAIGVVMAGAGEDIFSLQGLVYQFASILFESARVIMIQFLMSGAGLNMDPLVSLYYFAPVCAVTNFALSWLWGWTSFEWTHAAEVGFWMLLLNAFIAFLLNVSSVLLIGQTSALAFVLTGLFKNVLLVVAAVSIWGTPISLLQLSGYAILLLGLFLYQLDWDQLKAGWVADVEWGGEKSISEKIARATSTPSPRCVKKTMLVMALAAISLLLVLCYARREWAYGAPASATATLDEAERLSRGWVTWIHIADGKWWLQNG
ncbi:hypothetical protein DL764_009808 [Monosporascus ibericus]|uniref:Sugar phosphate transporter domain-containing protein n=1 Tax=Monosporascus ibericus TaxID=155417 RepID=A0A4Q4SWD7_9PEZI|nr:hypothetical protein DL764_009808 [Monosporascus ibericus]